MQFPKKFFITKEQERMAKIKAKEFVGIWHKYGREIKNGMIQIYGEFPKVRYYVITCPYSMADSDYVAISMNCNEEWFVNAIAHEINHVMFYRQFTGYCRENGIDIEYTKEIVTIINNYVCPSVNDMGYKIHFKQRIRAAIIWEKTHDIKKVVAQIKKEKIS